MARPVKYRFRAEILQILQADLFKVRLDLGFHCYKVLNIKLAGVVSIDPKDSPQSLAFAESKLLGQAGNIEVQTFRQLKDVWLSTLWVNNVSYNTELLKSPYGREFKQ